MKKNIFVLVLISIFLISAGGCAKRIKIETVEKERVDQDISSGNKGFLKGTRPPEEVVERKANREIYQVTLELPPYAEWKSFRFKPTVDKELYGNRGYVFGGPQVIKPVSSDEKATNEQENIVLPEDQTAMEKKEETSIPEIKATEQSAAFTTYTVQSGDTLEKISKKVYGSSKQWKKIYNFNSDVLKNPNKIYPGQKIKIPQQ